MADSRDHYQVLGLEPDADAEEIRRAHRRLVRVLHPDRHYEATPGERALADRRMREINEAWNTLQDPQRRKNYDATQGVSTRTTSGGDGARTSRTQDSATARARQPPASARSTRRSSSGSWTGPGESAGAGSGAYWRSTGTNGSTGHTGGVESDPEEEGIAVSPGAAFLLRRGPIVVIVAVVLGLFIVTAYVGGGGETRQVQPPPLEACARVVEGSNAILVPCSMPNDGEVVAQVDAALDCPPEAPRYVTVGTDFFCIPGAEPSMDGG